MADDDLSDRGLQQVLDGLVQRAGQIQSTLDDGGCACADRPEEEIERAAQRPLAAPPFVQGPPVTTTHDEEETATPADDSTLSVARRPFVFEFLRFPLEVRESIYEYYFADARRLLTEIAAVRVARDSSGTETRIRRYLRNTPREHRRFVLDHRHQESERRPIAWESNVPNRQRERGAITYEVYADNDALAGLPNDPLALLRVSRDMRFEAGATFLQSFRFTHPRERIIADGLVHHGILAAETFLTDRPANIRRLIRHIELDLGTSPRVRGGPTTEDSLTSGSWSPLLHEGIMAQPRIQGNVNWTIGIDRLDILATMLREMEFQHLTLNFIGQPPRWWQMGVTDPRNEGPNNVHQVAPWSVPLFNIGARDRLRLQLHFGYSETNPQRNADRAEDNENTLYNGIHTISIIRRFLLANAQTALTNQYTGIRVLLWVGEWGRGGTRTVEALVECDDQYLERSNSIVSRLRPRVFDVEGQPPQPTHNYDAATRPLPYVQPLPPPPQPQPDPWDVEEDEEFPSILGP